MPTDPSHRSAHDAEADPRNDDLRIWANGRIMPRAEAVVSVYDAGFMLGDGVWEGLRLHNGNLGEVDYEALIADRRRVVERNPDGR